MKRILFLTIATSILTTSLHAERFRSKGPNKRVDTEKRAERIAMEEEALLDRRDTHSLKALARDPEASDKRPESVIAYHRHTFKRIVRLSMLGSLSKVEADTFKEKHTEITVAANATDGSLTSDQKADIRDSLNDINDAINITLSAADKGNQRTPFVNRALHRFEERVEFGERSGRLSTGEASSIRRAIDRLANDVERAKSKSITLKVREKLIEDALEIERKINKELGD
ncbi:MAG: hypothetical protein AB8D78_08390 [Akkermansiaceae bacterium]